MELISWLADVLAVWHTSERTSAVQPPPHGAVVEGGHDGEKSKREGRPLVNEKASKHSDFHSGDHMHLGRFPDTLEATNIKE